MHVSFVETDLTAGLDIEKITPEAVATSAFDALERGEADAVVDDLSRDIKAGRHDELNLIYPNVEEQFNAAAAA